MRRDAGQVSAAVADNVAPANGVQRTSEAGGQIGNAVPLAAATLSENETAPAPDLTGTGVEKQAALPPPPQRQPPPPPQQQPPQQQQEQQQQQQQQQQQEQEQQQQQQQP